MPLYDYTCKNCKESQQRFRDILDRDNVVICGLCDRAMERTVASISRVWAPTRSGQ